MLVFVLHRVGDGLAEDLRSETFFLLKLFLARYFFKIFQLFFGGCKLILREEASPNDPKINVLTDHQLLESQKNLACGGLACSRCYDIIRYGSEKW